MTTRGAGAPRPLTARNACGIAMRELREIARLWREFAETPFPAGCAGDSVRGHCLVELDTFTAGCIDAFVQCSGELDRRRMEVLRNCARQLGEVVEELHGGAREYFARLKNLVHLVLAAAGEVRME